MDAAARANWLQTHTIFRDLPNDLVNAIAPCLTTVPFAANRRLILEDTEPDALYILKSGRLESYRTRKNSAAQVTELEPGYVLHLRSLLLNEPTSQTLVSLTDCTLWRLDKGRFQELAEEFSELSQELSRLLANELEEVSKQLAQEQERQLALRPYLVARVKRGVVGGSRYAIRLRKDIREATKAEPKSSRRAPILISGEPGLGKDNLAALIHFGSSNKAKPMIQVNCERLRAQDLFGKGDQPGLLDWLADGTLLLNNVQDLDEALKKPIVQLIETGQYQPVSREGDAPLPLRTSRAWVLMVAENAVPDIRRCDRIKQIKVPPLRVRKADIETQVNLLCTAAVS